MNQRDILNVLMGELNEDDRVVAMWVEGSLATGHENPASDIDLRIVVTEAFNYLELIRSIGEFYVFARDTSRSIGEREFIRVITQHGVVIDLDIYFVQDLDSIVVPQFKILLDKTGIQLKSMGVMTPPELWPAQHPDYNQLTIDLCVVMASIPTMFYGNNPESAMFQIDLMRVELVKLIYLIHGVKYANRYKHMRELFSSEWLKKLSLTYTSPQPHSIARCFVYTYRLIGECLDLASRGNFKADLYWSVYGKMCRDLVKF